MSKHVQDTIEFSLNAEKNVVNTTIKISAVISGVITPDVTEEALRENIRVMMKKFIDTTWQYSGTVRSKHESGMKTIRLTASTRVNETENYALEERAEKVSIPNMKISHISVDTSPPATMIEAAEAELRITLLEKAYAQLQAINSKFATDYRLGAVTFDNYGGGLGNFGNVGPKAAMLPYNTANFYSGNTQGGGSAPDDSLGNAVKLSMSANVQLKVTAS